MQAYMYSQLHMQAYTYSQLHMQAYTYSQLHMQAYTYSQLHMQTYTYNQLHMQAYTYSQLHMEAYMYRQLHMEAYTYSQLHMKAYTYSQLHMEAYTLDANTLETDRPQHNHAADCVIAQPYSSALVSLRFRCQKKNFGASFENVMEISLALKKTSVTRWAPVRCYKEANPSHTLHQGLPTCGPRQKYLQPSVT